MVKSATLSFLRPNLLFGVTIPGHPYVGTEPTSEQEWRHVALNALRGALLGPLDGQTIMRPVQLSVESVKSRPKRKPDAYPRDIWNRGGRSICNAPPDWDNVGRTISNLCEEAGIVPNDAAFWSGAVRTWYAAPGEGPCVEIRIYSL